MSSIKKVTHVSLLFVTVYCLSACDKLSAKNVASEKPSTSAVQQAQRVSGKISEPSQAEDVEKKAEKSQRLTAAIDITLKQLKDSEPKAKNQEVVSK